MAVATIQQFFLVIHGETEAHVERRICGGGWDPGLTPEGLQQARKLARSFARDKQGIKLIFSSPLLRSIQTTDVLHDVLKVKVRVISGLTERAMGQWEKALLDKVPGFSPLTEQIPGGESLNRFRARVRESLDYVLDAAASTRGSALIVTHGMFARTLLEVLKIPDQTLERCMLYRFRRENGSQSWQVEKL